ncbi:hypothetical protein [Cohnella zeiphila]|uniref:Uncharacterized protein n=1 Tax=Cohnella zeiphila TaxID=2761120 RepID=A0A7X0SH33_9BACL|nr:hypothetical protein [Cohnella zeiphila]MBB6729731.1 hypothetical protein [Cohnella zeiphila]
MTELQPLEAVFSSQEQAEEAIRKLASLRADRFRMERPVRGAVEASTAYDGAVPMNRLAESLLADAGIEAADELGARGDEPMFRLSAVVPPEAMDQARRVIAQSGGTVT